MIIPNIWKNNPNPPNHPPDFEYLGSFFCAKFVAVGFKKHQLHLHILVPGVTWGQKDEGTQQLLHQFSVEVLQRKQPVPSMKIVEIKQAVHCEIMGSWIVRKSFSTRFKDLDGCNSLWSRRATRATGKPLPAGCAGEAPDGHGFDRRAESRDPPLTLKLALAPSQTEPAVVETSMSLDVSGCLRVSLKSSGWWLIISG